jgi:hypothetical protein
VAEVGKNLGHGVSESELVRIGLLAQDFNFAQLLLAQFVGGFLERHGLIFAS